jgi:RNA polymerase subunit RPABC4/transcription elongation factor Spt4
LNIGEAEASTIVFCKAVGCDQCSHTGYRGRTGVFEVMKVTDALRRAIASHAPGNEIRREALAGGMLSLGEDGVAKVKSGATTVGELLRVVTEVREARTLCGACGTAVGADFLACPHCGKRLSGGCPHCGRALQPGWNFCPYCARTTDGRRAGRRVREDAGDPGGRPPSNVAEFKKPER